MPQQCFSSLVVILTKLYFYINKLHIIFYYYKLLSILTNIFSTKLHKTALKAELSCLCTGIKWQH